MSGFDLSDYKTVPERITDLKEKFPDAVLQAEIVDCPFEGFLAVKAEVWLTPESPRPATGLAWEPVPGKTPYTRDSELQNAETSAWGRAIVAALASDASKGIASQEDVRARQDTKTLKETWADWAMTQIVLQGKVPVGKAKDAAHDAMTALEYEHPIDEGQAKNLVAAALDLL